MKRALQDCRHRHVLKTGPQALDVNAEERQAEFKPDRLLDQDGDAPCRQQRIQQPAIEAAHDDALDDQADDRGDDEGERNGDQDVGVQPDARQHGGVGAEHHHLAMGHVDDAHRAIGDRKSKRHQQQDRAQAEADKHRVDHVVSTFEGAGPCTEHLPAGARWGGRCAPAGMSFDVAGLAISAWRFPAPSPCRTGRFPFRHRPSRRAA